jgi:hypothetical protein
MNRWIAALLLSLVSMTAMAGNSNTALDVGANVLPPMNLRVAAPAPQNGRQYQAASTGEQWVVDASATDAVSSYQSQLQQQGFAPVAGKDMTFRQASTGVVVVIQVKGSTGAWAISQLTVVAYSDHRDQAVEGSMLASL